MSAVLEREPAIKRTNVRGALPKFYSDQEPEMGESWAHSSTESILWYSLMSLLQEYDQDATVIPNMNFYYDPEDASANISPDVMVVPARIPTDGLVSYRLHETGPMPVFVAEVLSKGTWKKVDLERKQNLYLELGVNEYLLIDPDQQFMKHRLVMKVRFENRWIDQADRGEGVYSQLGCRIAFEEDERLRVFDKQRERPLPRPEEARMIEREKDQIIEQQAAEIARLKALSNPEHRIVMTAPQKVYIETVGCQMNVLDSELVVGTLKRQGYALTDSLADADVMLFNTCSVREHAEEKTYSALGRVVPFKNERPGVVVGVIGCMAQKDKDAIRDRAPYVDLVVGTGQLARIPKLIEEFKASGVPQYALSLGRADAHRHEVEASFESYDPARDPEMRPTPFQAFVRIQIGCDKFCTYCVVPSTRGPEQSRHPDHLVQEAKYLVDQGCREITLLGQTVNSYAFDHGNGRRTRFSDLILRLHDVNGLDRIKFVTNYPKDMTDDLLDVVREMPKVTKYLHVPVQSGCDEMLKRMKRGYTVGYYREMLARCREKVPGIAVSSDFIVGFCGETEASFEKTMDLTREAKFKNSFIFKYSERAGTKAAGLYPDDVPEDVKKRRNQDLLTVQNANCLENHKEQVGKAVEVLVEGPSRIGLKSTEPVRQQIGRTLTDHIVVFDAPDRLVGEIVTVDVDDASPFTLYGKVRTLETVGAVGRVSPPKPRRIALNVSIG